MIYKNSMKLLASNFSLVWKHLLFTIVRLVVVLLLLVLISNPIVRLLKVQGFAESVAKIGESLYTNANLFFPAIKQSINLFCSIISDNIATVWYSVILFFFVMIVVNNFIKNTGKYVLSYICHNNFTSISKCGYLNALVSERKNIFKYSISKFLFDLPFMALKILYIVIYYYMLSSTLLGVVGITLMIVLFTVTNASQMALCNNFAVEQIIKGQNPLKSVTRAYVSIKDYLKVFSNGIIIVLTIIVTNAIIGVFTVGAGLLITLPASMVLSVIFELVSYYTINKCRYYLSPTIIVDTINTI